ncbi:uncharacterized protein LY89DRAFT_721301 [Mollisia scopiformis]|uniref:NAD(P)-binding domain-containing protein n=1 Tax=Mollisia scopiformis TaxID=149040 RepID=A0A194WZ75_MOLSC|nr:uncharacterized protein LY89DRAFT_721301 [Mollisia scopiformis]KUJ13251.1 hypothetical protein LY89DRAFT_721301 [Mollisia scopiformis]
MTSTKLTIACFGATGGCVGTLLACALEAGYHCTALARTPEKLRNLLLTEHNIPSSTIEKYLTIHQGDVKDPTAISKVLINPTNPELLVDVIASGVGAYPTFQWSIKTPFPLTDPQICETAIRAIYTALSNLSSSSKPPITVDSTGQKPLLIAISTAGCGKKRGIPLPIYLPYHYLLSSSLADKKRMEEVVFQDKGKHVRDFVIMRPLILTDGKARGDGGLRVGWEWGIKGGDGRIQEKGPEIGYYISRKDVGIWTFEKVICQGGWEGKCVYLTY